MRNFITFCLFAAIIAKVALVLALGPASIELDAQGYWDLSRTVMRGDLLMMGEPIAYRTPIYPWFLAAIRSAFGNASLIALVAAQGTMLIASIGIAGRIATEATRSSWAMPLTLLVSLPAISAVTYSAVVLTESLFTFLLMLNLLSVLAYVRAKTPLGALMIGVTFALTLLTRPVVIYLWIPHLVLGLWTVSDLRRQAWHLGLATVAIAVILSPWMLRNQRLFGSPFLTEFLGRNLWIVTFQDGSGAGLDLPDTIEARNLRQRIQASIDGEQWRETWRVSNALVGSGMTDPDADRLMRTVSIEAIKSNPNPFAYKIVRRVANFWRCAVTDLPIQGSKSGIYRGQIHWSSRVVPIEWLIEHRLSRSVWINTLLTAILGAAVTILIIHADTRPFGIWIGLIFSYFALVTGLIEIPNYRYRVILEPLAAAAIGSAIVTLLSWRDGEEPIKAHAN